MFHTTEFDFIPCPILAFLFLQGKCKRSCKQILFSASVWTLSTHNRSGTHKQIKPPFHKGNSSFSHILYLSVCFGNIQIVQTRQNLFCTNSRWKNPKWLEFLVLDFMSSFWWLDKAEIWNKTSLLNEHFWCISCRSMHFSKWCMGNFNGKSTDLIRAFNLAQPSTLYESSFTTFAQSIHFWRQAFSFQSLFKPVDISHAWTLVFLLFNFWKIYYDSIHPKGFVMQQIISKTLVSKLSH